MFATFTIRKSWIVPDAGGNPNLYTAVVPNWNGLGPKTVSVQPDGSVNFRDPDASGGYEEFFLDKNGDAVFGDVYGLSFTIPVR